MKSATCVTLANVPHEKLDTTSVFDERHRLFEMHALFSVKEVSPATAKEHQRVASHCFERLCGRNSP
jgi:hypothetical protein